MKKIDISSLPEGPALDAQLWQALGHPMNKLHYHQGHLCVQEQYAHSLKSDTLESFDPVYIPGVRAWAIAWNPRTDPSIWARLLQRLEVPLKRSVRTFARTQEDLPTRVAKLLNNPR